MAVVHVPGKDVGRIMLYALSTCGWCNKTREFLEKMGVSYDYEYVDRLQGEERHQALHTLENWNPSRSFPTMVINDTSCIIGFKEDEIRKALVK